jgi:hypothetical protein
MIVMNLQTEKINYLNLELILILIKSECKKFSIQVKEREKIIIKSLLKKNRMQYFSLNPGLIYLIIMVKMEIINMKMKMF